jgi:nucleoside triphosphatase
MKDFASGDRSAASLVWIASGGRTPVDVSPDQVSPHRLIVVPVIFDPRGRILVCKKPIGRGVFPGQWGLPGGGVEPGERLEEALRREVREEVGLELEDIRPLHFKEGVEAKHLGRGQEVSVPMVYLLFSCTAATTNVSLNDEFVEFAWVMPSELPQVDLNAETIRTFKELGILHDGAA